MVQHPMKKTETHCAPTEKIAGTSGIKVKRLSRPLSQHQVVLFTGALSVLQTAVNSTAIELASTSAKQHKQDSFTLWNPWK